MCDGSGVGCGRGLGSLDILQPVQRRKSVIVRRVVCVVSAVSCVQKAASSLSMFVGHVRSNESLSLVCNFVTGLAIGVTCSHLTSHRYIHGTWAKYGPKAKQKHQSQMASESRDRREHLSSWDLGS